jgi:hypothetical protein
MTLLPLPPEYLGIYACTWLPSVGIVTMPSLRIYLWTRERERECIMERMFRTVFKIQTICIKITFK